MTRDGLPGFNRAIRALRRTQVLVGVPAAHADRKEDEQDGPITNAVIAYLNETGSPAMNIPPRPHIGPGIAAAEQKLVARIRKAGDMALGGDVAAVLRQMQAVGLIAQNSIRAQITDGALAPLAESTLRARRARGRTGEAPLIDTGQYRRSITFVIRPK